MLRTLSLLAVLDGCAVAKEAARAARLLNLRRVLDGADQYLVRFQASAAFGFLCGVWRMRMKMIKSL